ncbi:MAG: radical SAM protein [Candidatus Thorarchaeota archaeon]|nr:MAG: radical SAM protein [Candidatus Thorarchaeota archaeon]
MYQTKVEYGDYTINHVLGCAHGCDYPCYAMQLSKRYGRVSGREDWMSPKIVGNAMSLLEKELPRLASKIRFVHLSFMTDPFMYDVVNERTYPWIRNLTLSIIRRLNQEGIKVTVLTKGLLPEELADSHFGKDNEYGVTLVSYNPEFHAKYEPFSPCAEDRLSKLRRLSDAGLRTWVSLEPYPTPNIVKQDLMKILEQIDFVDKIIFGKWNYNPEVSRFENSRRFYMDCSDQVIRFCSEKGISFHIKERTPRSSSRTHSLFKE